MINEDSARLAGQLLAEGYSQHRVLQILETPPSGLSPQEAREALRAVFESWKSELDLESLRAQHVELRHVLLQKAMSDSSIAHLRLALAILDSLASVQGLKVTEATPQGMGEIRVMLIPVASKETQNG